MDGLATLQAPFPWFGGKSRVARLVWERFGNPPNYVEPFFGSGAVLLGRPGKPGIETVNDRDGFVANFWRSIAQYPDDVARHADWPANENDLHARHAYLVGIKDDLVPRLEGNPDFCEPKVAGWWVWGICCWIGSEWCSGNGPWSVVDGKLVHLGSGGQGVNRKRVHLGSGGQGVNRKRVHLQSWFSALAERLRDVRVCCGDWARVVGPSPTVNLGVTAVFLDPPYGGDAGRHNSIYACEDLSVAAEVNAWCAANGDNPMLRIALCGYDGEHDNLEGMGWDVVAWKTSGGYGSQGCGAGRVNAHRERIWFSPHCIDPRQGSLL